MEKSLKKFKSAKERFKYYLEIQGKSKNNFYEISGMSNGLLDKNGGLNEDSILKICEVYPEISLDWLILENGKMIRSDIEKTVAMASAPQAIANNGDMAINTPAELLQLLTSQQETIKSLSRTIEHLTTEK